MMADSAISKRRILTERRVVFICFLVALGQFQYGYDSAAVAGFQSMPGFLAVHGYADPANPIGFNIRTDVQRLIQSLMNVGGFLAAVAIYAAHTRVSRRAGLWAGCAFAFVSISLQLGLRSLAGLYAGRLLLGVSNGLLVPYCLTYMASSAPSLLRGPVVGMSTFQTSLGALLGIVVDNYCQPYGGAVSWMIPLAVIYAVPAFLTVLLLFLPDTPRFYVAQGRDEQAMRAIRRLRGVRDQARLRAEVEDIRSAYLMEREIHAGVHLSDMFKGPDLRRTLLSYGANVAGIATGVTFMSGFSVYLFVQARVGSPFDWVMISLAIALTGKHAGVPGDALLWAARAAGGRLARLVGRDVRHGRRLHRLGRALAGREQGARRAQHRLHVGVRHRPGPGPVGARDRDPLATAALADGRHRVGPKLRRRLAGVLLHALLH
ncbi:MFS general substrate transporter [Thermothelomyces heterothallicus CBS 203.75]